VGERDQRRGKVERFAGVVVTFANPNGGDTAVGCAIEKRPTVGDLATDGHVGTKV
jgi:hypothetical protein